jgi:ATP-dependent RNA helicase DDX46/PRP5
MDSPAMIDPSKLTAKERLELWRKKREMEKLKDGKASSLTPEPTDKKPSFSSISSASGEPSVLPLVKLNPVAPAPLAKTKTITMGAVGRFGLPLKGGVPPKRSFSALNDDDEESDRKLQKLDLPDINPEPQTGKAVAADTIGTDLAVEEDVKPVVPEDKMDVDEKPKVATVAEEEEDELDAYMRETMKEVKEVNTKDAKRMGLMNLEDESEDEEEVQDKAGDELAKAEALLA